MKYSSHRQTCVQERTRTQPREIKQMTSNNMIGKSLIQQANHEALPFPYLCYNSCARESSTQGFLATTTPTSGFPLRLLSM